MHTALVVIAIVALVLLLIGPVIFFYHLAMMIATAFIDFFLGRNK